MQKILESINLDYAFMFTHKKVNSISMEGFDPFFADLPVDPYMKAKYRYRRLSRFILSGEKVIKQPHGYIFQGKNYNPLPNYGDVKREYAEIDDKLVALDNFKKMILAFCDSCKIHPEAEIGIHQIRTICYPNSLGNPAPEGIHQDGTDFIGIFVVNRHNIQGGATHLYTAKKEKPVFSKILNPGDLLLANDHEFFHFTTPIKPVIEEMGYRDVFVLTSPSLIH